MRATGAWARIGAATIAHADRAVYGVLMVGALRPPPSGDLGVQAAAGAAIGFALVGLQLILR